MKELQIILISLFVSLSVLSLAQDNRTLLTVGDEEVSVDEFMYVYKKNNVRGESIDKKSIKDYLELYINFKLKVKEAEAEGLDTVQAFIDELAGYRAQLAEPYFTDESIIEDLLVEAYERKKFDIRASHILIKVSEDALPEDTLLAYEKSNKTRERIVSGEKFSDVAKEVSEDPSANDRVSPRNQRTIPGNGGDLGYFTVFDMVYPFETAAYSTEVGSISMPVRTSFGYHIIKVSDRIPAQGSIDAAHLFIKMPENATHKDSVNTKLKVDSIYMQIIDGKNYEDMVTQYSDDKGSSTRGGILPKFTVNRMVPEFIQVISAMNDSGAISKPVLTNYGWHIIKLYSKTGVGTFENVEPEMRKRLKKDKRALKSNEVIIEDIKKEYGFKLNTKAIKDFYTNVDSSLYQGEWVVNENMKLDEDLFVIGDQSYNQHDFAGYLELNQKIAPNQAMYEFINKTLREYTDTKVKQYEDDRLESKYPEFKAIMKEYRDGILLFELTNQKVWAYATQDTVGLKNYYEEHKNDFMWDARLDASIVTVTDTASVNAIRELMSKEVTDKVKEAEIFDDSLSIVTVERKKFSKGDNELIDSIKWKKGITNNLVTENDKVVFVKVHGKISPEPKTFDEARGLVTAGYQEYLEEKWIEELRAKYSYKVDDEVLSSLTN